MIDPQKSEGSGVETPDGYTAFDLSDLVQWEGLRSRYGIYGECREGKNWVFVHKAASLMDLRILIKGTENQLRFGPDCGTRGTVTIEGSSSSVHLEGKSPVMNLGAHLYSGATLIVGPRVTAYGMRIWVASRTRLDIAHDCQFSEGIYLRTTDHHSLFDIDTLARLNFPEDVEIGPYVWLGQDVAVMKGVTIGAGSIIGARSVVTRCVGPMQLWAGSPARMLRNRVSWVDPHPAEETDFRARITQLEDLLGARLAPHSSVGGAVRIKSTQGRHRWRSSIFDKLVGRLGLRK